MYISILLLYIIYQPENCIHHVGFHAGPENINCFPTIKFVNHYVCNIVSCHYTN